MAAKKRNNQRAETPATPDVSSAADTSGEPARVPAERASGPPVAGIGASAGGLDAFKKLFAAMPVDSGIAFVLVPHLDPAHESLMVELLSRHTTMPVVEAKNDLRVEANHVYIIPPNKYMTIHGGVLRLTGPVERHSSQTSIDVFLRSLANDRQERAICIILSGTGSHGTLGLRAVKGVGGLALVQDPPTAEYDRMPQSAIATGLADYILAVEQMPAALLKYVKHSYVNGGVQTELAPEAADHLTKLLALLRARTKFDFRYYRKSVLSRRVQRRMGLSHIDNIPEYLVFLRAHPEEVKLLVKDLFISVTSFFRDPAAFEQLASEVIAPLIQNKSSDGAIRVWVPGCATGEEPYSIAMLLQEHLAAAHKTNKVQIFATDVDEDALEVARLGIYPDTITADVSRERLSRFFTLVDDHTYRINRELREKVIFAPQNLISDAPFTKLDLISCRNVLIYLEPEVQTKVVALFHFALLEGGFLFLGPSETIGRQNELFESRSRKWRIYRRIGPTRLDRVDFPILPSVEGRAQRLSIPADAQQPNFAELAKRLLLARFTPAAVLINRKYHICYYFGPCADYLELPVGTPTHDLMVMAREGLVATLRGAVHRALEANEMVVLPDVPMKRNDAYHAVRVTVQPLHLPKAAEGLLLVTFEEARAQAPSRASQPSPQAPPDALSLKLENELKATREDLQNTIEELECSNEELKASNEEVMSMNEELQSTNEELESSKEELQSLNEELTTVNNQLQDKVVETEKASNDMSNLLKCTEIATVFLDRELGIKQFTPAATKLFNLITSDIGRPLGDMTSRFTDPDLLDDARLVLSELAPREKEVATKDGSWLRRIIPYRTEDNRIEGVVLTFSEVTVLRRLDEALRAQLTAEAAAATRLLQLSSRLWRPPDLREGLNEVLAAAIELVGADKGNVQLLNAEHHVLNIVTHRGFEQPFLQYFSEVSAKEESACGRALRSGSQIVIEDFESDPAFAPHRPVARAAGVRAVVSTPLQGRDGRPLGMISTHFRVPHRPSKQDLRRLELYGRRAADFIERCGTDEALRASDEQLRKLNESLERQVAERTQALTESEGRFRLMADTAPVMIWMSGIDLQCTWVSKPWLDFVGRTLEQELGNGWIENIHPDDYNHCLEIYAAAFNARQPLTMEYRMKRRDGEYRWLFDNGIPMYKAGGEFTGYIGSCIDITERKRAEQALQDSEARLRAIVDSTGDAIITIDHQGIIQSVNPTTERMFGYTAAEMVGQSVKMLMASPHRETHDQFIARYLQTGERHVIGTHREVVARRKDGAVFPTDLAVNEIPQLKLFTGIHRDITEQRRLERELVEVASQQQKLIGQDLHDTVSQELTALSIQAGDLADALRTDPAQAAKLVDQITSGLRRSQHALRAVMRGLLPVSVDAEGLMAALSDLADQTQKDNKVNCTFQCPEPVAVSDNLTATHLFLIAQEAVHNAIKHGKPRHIRIRLESNTLLTLCVEDDGAGITGKADAGGLGMRIMRNRAAVIGATLLIEPAQPTGTRVQCTLPRLNHAKNQNRQTGASPDRR